MSMDNLTRALELAPNGKKEAAAIFMRLGLLRRRYEEKHRFYHNLDHVEHGYQIHNKFFGLMDTPTFFAWTYHDSIYEPTAKDNEAQSAKLFMEDNSVLGFSMRDADQIAMLILSTTHTGEKNLITDIDLSGLGSDPEVYDANTAKIRREYAFASDEMWKAGRTAFIERFLAQDSIFFTPQFVSQFEAKARKNMSRELDRLKSI